MTELVRIEGLKKYFPGRIVLKGIDLAWRDPGTTALFGVNGSGKSTLLGVLGGVLVPDAGDVFLGGHSLRRARAAALTNVGYAPVTAEYPPHLTVRELFELFASLRGTSAPRGADLELFEVTPLLRQRFGSLSLGQRQRVCLTITRIGDPSVLLLDEPSTGLDTDGLARLEALLADRKARGHGALVATHDRAFADRIADRTLSIADGRLT